MSEKLYVCKEDLNKVELESGCVSYARLVKRIIGDNLVLCNNINGLDDSFLNNLNKSWEDMDYDIYQYYLCDLSEYAKELNEKLGCPLILGYSDMLELDVLLVDHFGTGWDYVLTDVEWTEDFVESL